MPDTTSTKKPAPNVSEHPMMDEVIRCEKLTKLYPAGNILAVDQLNMTVIHDCQAVADRIRFFHVMGSQQDRLTFCV